MSSIPSPGNQAAGEIGAQPTSADEFRQSSRARFSALLVLPLVTAIGYILYTGEIWEDFFITFRHTENLVRGHGLVYQAGERVHGFTSVLNVLLPAPALLLSDTVTAGLRFYQACSIVVMLFGLAALMKAMRRRLESSWGELAVLSVLVATSIKIVAFSTNGQEGGLLVGFLGFALAGALRLDEHGQWRWLGLAWAGLLYTRPDSPVYMVAIGVVALAMFSGSRRDCVIQLFCASGVAAVAYVPWFVTAWMYYGSPVPHTIVAKSTGHLLVRGGVLGTLMAMWSQLSVIVADVFGPIYQPGNWPQLLLVPAKIAGCGAALYWAVPVRDKFGRACSGGLFILLGYLAWVGTQHLAYPWYFVPASLLGAIVATRAATMTLKCPAPWVRLSGVAGTVALIAMTSICLALSFKQMRIQQSEIEEQTRKQAGLWLRQNAKPGDTVYSECLGYIGYFFGGKMLDYPGLVAPEVVAARRQHGDEFGIVPLFLKPTWILARNDEVANLLFREENKKNYKVVGRFDASERLDRYGGFAGESFLRHDAVFFVFRRVDGDR